MTTCKKPRLCVGTFFVLVLRALKQRNSVREHFKGERDGLSDTEVMIGLIKVINPDYVSPKYSGMKNIVSGLKQCRLSKGEYVPFDEIQEISAFDKRVREDYHKALSDMNEFVEGFIDTGISVHKDENLVKALIDLIQKDETIQDDDSFFISENGEQKKKAELNGLKMVCLPAFLLGVWHYTVLNRKDNTIGKDTYNEWCPANGGGNRRYVGDMGRQITWNIEIYIPTLDTETGNENVAIENHGTVNVTQQLGGIPQHDGAPNAPINREYYNIFVVDGEEFNEQYFKIPKDRALSMYMSDRTKKVLAGMTPKKRRQLIITMPSLFMAENNHSGRADDDQKVIYGFVSDCKVYENDVKIYWKGLKNDISQVRINEILEELQLSRKKYFNELNKTHWSIKRCDLISELQDAGIDIPIFKQG